MCAISMGLSQYIPNLLTSTYNVDIVHDLYFSFRVTAKKERDHSCLMSDSGDIVSENMSKPNPNHIARI